MKKAKVIAIWVIGILFIAAGLSKFLNLDTMSADMFRKAHFPFWLYYIAASFEFLGGLLLIRNATRRIGTAMIACVMLGAIVTHLLLGDHWGHIIVPVLILVLCGSWIRNSR